MRIDWLGDGKVADRSGVRSWCAVLVPAGTEMAHPHMFFNDLYPGVIGWPDQKQITPDIAPNVRASI